MRNRDDSVCRGSMESSGCLLVRTRLPGISALAVLATVALVCAVMIAATARPAAAQGGRSVEATGTLEKPELTAYMYGTHAITDESTGTFYALKSEAVDLDQYVGERVTISGAVVPGYEEGEISAGPALVEVSSIERGDRGSDEDQYEDIGGSIPEPQPSAPVEGPPSGGSDVTETPARLPDTGGVGLGAALLAAGLVVGAFLLRRR